VPAPERTTSDSSQRRNRIYSIQVQGKKFEQLLWRCKAEGTTVTGKDESFCFRLSCSLCKVDRSIDPFHPIQRCRALTPHAQLDKTKQNKTKKKHTPHTAAMAAAVVLEIKALIPGPAAALKIETMVNLRSQLAAEDPRLAEALHLFAAPIDMVLSITAEANAAAAAAPTEPAAQGPSKDQSQQQLQQQQQALWARARAFKADLNEAMARGQWRQQVAAFHTFKRGNNMVYRVLERLAVGPNQGRVKAAAVSNLGTLDFKLGTAAGVVSRLQWGITEHVSDAGRSLLIYSCM
jgi:hypothetical protein